MTLRRLPWVRVRAAVDHDIAVGCPPALVASLVNHLHVHRRPHPGLHVLPFGLAHPAQDAH